LDWDAARPQIEAWVAEGLSEVLIAAHLGISNVALRRWLKQWNLRTLAGQQKDARQHEQFRQWLAEMAKEKT